jgi:hypothetical protein
MGLGSGAPYWLLPPFRTVLVHTSAGSVYPVFGMIDLYDNISRRHHDGHVTKTRRAWGLCELSVVGSTVTRSGDHARRHMADQADGRGAGGVTRNAGIKPSYIEHALIIHTVHLRGLGLRTVDRNFTSRQGQIPDPAPAQSRHDTFCRTLRLSLQIPQRIKMSVVCSRSPHRVGRIRGVARTPCTMDTV